MNLGLGFFGSDNNLSDCHKQKKEQILKRDHGTNEKVWLKQYLKNKNCVFYILCYFWNKYNICEKT